MTTTVESAREAISERLNPALESIEESVRQVRRSFVVQRHAAEDLVAEGALQVRRHPLSAVAVAGAAGALVGCMLGFALGWRPHRR
jgi:ElaB/YqjD/DUF883 family membrane-anchored ribosome-binding protein